jgi:putative NADH-flavin reductase
MKLAVFGATGKTGLEIIKQALHKGEVVTAFVRDAARMQIKDKRLIVVTGDVFDQEIVDLAVQGQDAVICALGAGNSLKKTTIRTTGTIHIIRSMQVNNIKRLMVVSAMGVGESWDTLSLLNKIFFATVLRHARKDHESQESVVRESGLEWTIVRPSGLTDTSRTGNYDYGENIRAKTSRISRADVADLILKAIEQDAFIGKAVTITH